MGKIKYLLLKMYYFFYTPMCPNCYNKGSVLGSIDYFDCQNCDYEFKLERNGEFIKWEIK